VTKRYLLDTGPSFDFLFRRRGVDARVEEARRSGAKVGICIPVLGEIVAGLEASHSREASWEIARRKLGKLVCWPFDKASAYEYGRIFAELKARGQIIQQVDMQIAAIALTLRDCTVVTTDGDLQVVPGLAGVRQQFFRRESPEARVFRSTPAQLEEPPPPRHPARTPSPRIPHSDNTAHTAPRASTPGSSGSTAASALRS
jgi:tRNA(fMet)-specific endonuclease VapC